MDRGVRSGLCAELAIVIGALGGCGVAAVEPHATTLKAPPAATWLTATVLTNYDQSRGQGELFPHDYEQTKVSLVVARPGESHSIILDDAFGFAGGTAHALAKRRYELAASPDGSWILVGDQRGWVLVEPASLMVCRHLGLRGRPEALWAQLPTPATLALDLLADGDGPLHVEHGGAQELRQAGEYALAHADQPAMRPALAAGLLAQPDNLSLEVIAPMIAALRPEDPATRARLQQVLERVRGGHMRSAWIAAEALWPAPETQAALARWIALAVAPGGPKIYEYEAVTLSDWGFAHDVWDLARLVERDHAVTPDAERAAIAVIAHASKLLPSAAARAKDAELGSPGRPWGSVSPAAQAAATYAIQILAAAHTATARAAINAADFDRNDRSHPPPVRYADPIKDYLVPYRDLEHADVDAWFRWAAAQ